MSVSIDELKNLLIDDWCILSKSQWDSLLLSDVRTEHQILDLLCLKNRFELANSKIPFLSVAQRTSIDCQCNESMLVWVSGQKWLKIQELGRGSFGEVWLGCPCRSDVDRSSLGAIKIPSKDSRSSSLDEIARLESLSSPNIARLLTMDSSTGVFVTEFVEGNSLEHSINSRRRLTVASVVRIGLEIGNALLEVHRHGWIHRDVKPSNIILGNDRAVLIDFGLTRDPATGGAAGTPHYIAPELYADNGTSDARSDVYSLAATLYAALIGFPPSFMSFLHPRRSARSRASLDVLNFHFSDQVVPFRIAKLRPDIPNELCSLIAAALNFAPAARPWPIEFLDSLNLIEDQLKFVTRKQEEARDLERELWKLVQLLQTIVHNVAKDPIYTSKEMLNLQSISEELAGMFEQFGALDRIHKTQSDWLRLELNPSLVRETVDLWSSLRSRLDCLTAFVSGSVFEILSDRESIASTLVSETIREIKSLAFETLALAHQWRSYVAEIESHEASCEANFNPLPPVPQTVDP
ncbi:MAG: serine/threonine-protein kinase [Pirellulales bacterium]